MGQEYVMKALVSMARRGPPFGHVGFPCVCQKWGAFGVGLGTAEWGTRVTSGPYRASQTPSGDGSGKDNVPFGHGIGQVFVDPPAQLTIHTFVDAKGRCLSQFFAIIG